MIGLGLLKTVGTVLTVASTASFGKDMYEKYKDKKKGRQLNEVHQFISALDLEALQEAIDGKNEVALIDAVEDIMIAAEAVRVKSDMEELKDDATDAAEKIFGTVTSIVGKVTDKVAAKLDEVKEAVEDMEDENLDTVDNCSYKGFKKHGGCLFVVGKDSTEYELYANSPNVFTSNKEKKVTYITPTGEAIITQLS